MLAKYDENGAKKLQKVGQTHKRIRKNLGSIRSINKARK
jgi:hypothetical protein